MLLSTQILFKAPLLVTFNSRKRVNALAETRHIQEQGKLPSIFVKYLQFQQPLYAWYIKYNMLMCYLDCQTSGKLQSKEYKISQGRPPTSLF